MPDVTITLTDDEALVLFEFLARFTDTDLLGTEDQAEQRALWNLHCLLERQIVASFAPNYRELLVAARDALRDDGGTDAQTESSRGRLAFWLDPADVAFIVDQWRKMPNDLADDDRKRWADIAFRGMSALKKAGINYTAKPTTTCYHEVQRPDDSDGSVTLTSWSS
ncbi:hypothetical protein Poly51_59940 [Rubripirellula tenax]|uniref:Uncharacterized protein n=1 Tax=Rubripirellula tenax TaxID=2528015 RepID=A0A5C6E884_9BACT|nr:hypothetical protein [Rubripirellula tenax]TWU44725.1 hypothetical protein Poly51_59940 [Rubripirellula tenax]